MPAPAKSFWPALAGFIGECRCTQHRVRGRHANRHAAFSFTYTAVVARGEGNTIDAARSRWQAQKRRGDEAITAHGTQWLEEHKE